MSLTDAFLLDPAPFNVWIAYRGDGAGSGTANDPYDGKTAARFDAIMNQLSALPAGTPIRVHLGPTQLGQPFQTSGFCVASGDPLSGSGWELRPGMKIIGSGMDVTVLQLVGTTQNAQYFAIAHALRIGSGTSQDPYRPNPKDQVEVADLTIDCNVAATSTAACGAIRLMGSHCRIRRVKVINWGTKSYDYPCHALSIIAAIAGNSTEAMHYLLETVNSGIEDCIVILPSHNSKREAVALHIGGVEGPNGVQGYGKSPFIRNNYVDGASSSGATLAVLTASSTNTNTGEFVCKRPHFRSANEYARFAGGTGWNGYFRISGIPASPLNALTVDLSSGGGSWTAPLPICGAEIHGIFMASCRGGVVEGNQIHNVWLGGSYADVLNTKEIIIRNNTYKNVVTGPYWSLIGDGATTEDATRQSYIAGVARLHTDFPHNLFARASLLINGLSRVRVTQVLDAWTFEIAIGADPGATVDYQLQRGIDKLVVEGNVIELADLDATEYALPDLLGAAEWAPVAVSLRGPEITTPSSGPAFGDVVIRNNKIRYLDGKTTNAPTGQPMAGTAIQVRRAENLLIQNNVVEMIPANPLKNLYCSAVKYFNNQTPVGLLVQGYEANYGFRYSELATEAEDAFIMAYLER